MTREEAIEQLKQIPIHDAVSDDYMKSIYEALDMAIKALEQEPCDDVISREDALKALCQAVHKNDDNIPCPNQRVSCLWNKTKVQDYAEEILKLPPATPQQRTGRWIRMKAYEKWGCSECNTVFRFTFKEHDYCPNCGAKMKGVEE